jgi:hypothetical protein
VVDGIWIPDPKNRQQLRKLNGAVLSVVPLANLPVLDLLSPEINPVPLADGKYLVAFRYSGESGQEIFVGASFNSFDPYLHLLRERIDQPGLYELSIRLRPGQYLYYYVVNGKKVLDPRNRAKGWYQGSAEPAGDYSLLSIEAKQ